MSAIAEPESTESGFQAGRYAAIDIGTVDNFWYRF